MHHAVDVEEVQPAAYLAEVVPRELLAHALAAVPRRVVHRPARHVLERHEHVLPRGVVDDLVQANDVGMHQLLHDGDLTLQPRVGAGAPARQTQTELASQRPAVDALQRAQPVGVRVEAELHLAERALAQVLDDDVLVQVHVTARVRAEVERLSVPEVTDAEAPVAERIDGGHRARGLPQNPPGAFSHPVRVVWDNHQASPDRTAMSWRQPLANGDSAGPNGRILARYYRIARILRPSAGRVTRRARARDSEDR